MREGVKTDVLEMNKGVKCGSFHKFSQDGKESVKTFRYGRGLGVKSRCFHEASQTEGKESVKVDVAMM